MSRDFILPGVGMSFKEGFVLGSVGSYGYSVWFSNEEFVPTNFQSSAYGPCMQAVRSNSPATLTIKALKSGYFIYGGPISSVSVKPLTKKRFEAGATILSYELSLSNTACVVLAI